MWWKKFVAYAKTQYGVEFTPQEAKTIRERFFATYSGLEDWHEKMRAFARKNKYVRSYSGRIRHLPMIDSSEDYIKQEAERQAINSPVQNFGSDLGVMAVSRMHEEIDDKYIKPMGFVHDAIYCYVPKRYLLWAARTLKWFMETNPLEEWFGVKMKVPIIADASFGINLNTEYEMEGLTLDFDAPYDFSKFEGLEIPRQRIPPNDGDRVKPLYSQIGDTITLRNNSFRSVSTRRTT